MKATTTRRSVIDVAARIAPEDLQRGDHVAVLSTIEEYPSFLWNGETPGHEPGDTVRVRYQSDSSRIPLRIVSICLPFVFVKSPTDAGEMLDIRRVELVRLSSSFARRAWKCLKHGRKKNQ